MESIVVCLALAAIVAVPIVFMVLEWRKLAEQTGAGSQRGVRAAAKYRIVPLKRLGELNPEYQLQRKTTWGWLTVASYLDAKDAERTFDECVRLDRHVEKAQSE